jgi:hypothetical protein
MASFKGISARALSANITLASMAGPKPAATIQMHGGHYGMNA